MSEAPKNKKGAPVFTYLAIMFAVAFLMLLLAYFIQQRNNEVAMDGLKDSISSFESLDEVLEDNRQLREEIEELEEEKAKLSKALDELQAERDLWEDRYYDEEFSHKDTFIELCGWEIFWDIEALFQAEEYEECAAMIKTLANSTYYFTPDTAQTRANEIWAALEAMGLLTEEDAKENFFRVLTSSPPQG